MRGGDLEMLKRAVVLLKRERETIIVSRKEVLISPRRGEKASVITVWCGFS